ncbi:MAG: AbgT family transporter [Pseudomonadales bacterium]|nr:AbgT family transporter [Pseudomonadales bacterium]
MSDKTQTSEQSITSRLLLRVERAGNRLPHPTLLFMWLALGVIALSWLLSSIGIEVLHPLTQQPQAVNNLANGAGLRRILSEAVSNFTRFAPVGVVLVTMLGIGIAEHAGLLACLLRKVVAKARPASLAYVVAFAGVISSLGADVGYVVLIPLAALLYHANNRPPLAGIAVAFAGVSAGFSANLLLGPVDVMLAGISTEAARLVQPDAMVAASDNYYFIIVSTFLITLLAGAIGNRIVEPRLQAGDAGKYELAPTVSNEADNHGIADTQNDNQSLALVGWFSLFYGLLLVALAWPGVGALSAQGGERNPLLSNVVPLLALYFGLAGYLFGRSNGVYRNASQALVGMENAMSTMAYYLVLMFFAAQFVNYFAWSNIGSILAIAGASALSDLQGYPVLLMLAVILLSALINLFVGSASAKWALLAPILVPMLLLLDVPPEQTQMAYRIGDSTTNIITPLMPYFGIVLAYAQRYRQNLGLGHIIAMMLPFSVALLLGWSILIVIWVSLSLPFGP